MDVKLTITNVCGARCATCPNWRMTPKTMPFTTFATVWRILNDAPEVSRILINNVELPDAMKYLLRMQQRKKKALMITNGNHLKYVPKIDGIIISFNGGTKETYEKTTGLNFHRVITNIKNAYPQLRSIKMVEMHCLIWKGNMGDESAFKELWADFPGRLRISYKVENQGGDDLGLVNNGTRRRCKYLDCLSVAPSGTVLSCAHDFAETTNWGNVLTDKVSTLMKHPSRLAMRATHEKGTWPGLCENCNYNVPEEGKINICLKANVLLRSSPRWATTQYMQPVQ